MSVLADLAAVVGAVPDGIVQPFFIKQSCYAKIDNPLQSSNRRLTDLLRGRDIAAGEVILSND
jgi:hypothetical protein